ncbi:MAG: hypothetical protein ACK4NF_06385, partial [Planctomycetota bacterium]
MCLDFMPLLNFTKEQIKDSNEKTLEWAKKCKEYHERIQKKIFGEKITIKYFTSVDSEKPLDISASGEQEEIVDEELLLTEEAPKEIYEIVEDEEMKENGEKSIPVDHTVKKILETFSGKIVEKNDIS